MDCWLRFQLSAWLPGTVVVNSKKLAAEHKAWHIVGMIDKPPRRPKVDTQMARALARWEGEGGAPQMFPRSLQDVADVLADPERHILECLGAAVVLGWNDFPTNVQRAIFRHATAVKELRDASQLKLRIARFLHDHKDDVDEI